MDNHLIVNEQTDSSGTAKIIYILYLASIFFGVTAIIGIIIAYVNKEDAPDWLKTHYQVQIRTFWIGLLYCCIGFILAIVVIGYLILLFNFIWLIVRCVKGIKYIDRKMPYPNPRAWLF